MGSAQLPRLRVVEEQDVDDLRALLSGSSLALDPVVHGVAEDQLGRRTCSSTCALQHRVDVGQEDVVAVAVGLGDLRREVLEDVELGVQGVGLVEVVS